MEKSFRAEGEQGGGRWRTEVVGSPFQQAVRAGQLSTWAGTGCAFPLLQAEPGRARSGRSGRCRSCPQLSKLGAQRLSDQAGLHANTPPRGPRLDRRSPAPWSRSARAHSARSPHSAATGAADGTRLKNNCFDSSDVNM